MFNSIPLVSRKLLKVDFGDQSTVIVCLRKFHIHEKIKHRENINAS